MKKVPAKTPESDVMSKDLKRRGFKFVGSTICYAFMQAVGHGERSPCRVFPAWRTVEDGQKTEMKQPTGDPWFV